MPPASCTRLPWHRIFVYLRIPSHISSTSQPKPGHEVVLDGSPGSHSACGDGGSHQHIDAAGVTEQQAGSATPFGVAFASAGALRDPRLPSWTPATSNTRPRASRARRPRFPSAGCAHLSSSPSCSRHRSACLCVDDTQFRITKDRSKSDRRWRSMQKMGQAT